MSADISPLLVRTPAAAVRCGYACAARRPCAHSINVLHGAAVGQPVYLDAGHLVQRYHLRRRYGVAAAACR